MRGRQRGAQGWQSGGRRPRHHDRRRAQRRQRQSPSPVVERIVRRRRTGTRQRGQRGDRLHRRRHGQIDATQQHGTTPSRAWPAAHRREDPATPRQWCVRQVQLQYKSERDKSRDEGGSVLFRRSTASRSTMPPPFQHRFTDNDRIRISTRSFTCHFSPTDSDRH